MNLETSYHYTIIAIVKSFIHYTLDICIIHQCIARLIYSFKSLSKAMFLLGLQPELWQVYQRVITRISDTFEIDNRIIDKGSYDVII